MFPCGLAGLLLAPRWARLQHYASLTGLPLLPITVFSKTHTNTHAAHARARTQEHTSLRALAAQRAAPAGRERLTQASSQEPFSVMCA